MANDPGERLAAGGAEWHEGRLIDAHIYINDDGSEGCSATFGYGLSLDERKRLVQQAATLLANARFPEPPPPRS